MIRETRDLNGHPFHLCRWGTDGAPALLMLHGFPEYGGAWSDLAPLLAHRFHCIAPDQRGYGQSWSPPDIDDYRLSELVSDMAALIDTFGGRATVLGHDWGSAVAYGLAMRHPERIPRLIVANGVHPVPFQRALATGGAQAQASQYIHQLRRDGSENILAANDYEKLLAAFSAHMDLGWMTPDRLTGYKAAWSQGGGRLRTMIHWYRASPLQVPLPGETITDLPDWPPDQMRIRCPHLLLWGMGDTALLPEATDGLEEFAPILTRIPHEDADHWICHQKPHAVAGAILDWTG
ncbi:MAG: alpha/beta fold hydrolase [Marinibacterium sp.]